ncbi:type II toxin-antitoxin system mRNA interferase toxin, RelE/StbE family [bacterium]|nr:MAG: type II toxin-antitoxin system mRNA interferase toxin, RelE/StbE family [bacterium]
MAYSIEIEKRLQKKLKKLGRGDPVLHARLLKKINDILNHPHQETPYQGKPLGNVMKGSFRVHIGSFVLVYGIDDAKKVVVLKDFEHHDKVYSN